MTTRFERALSVLPIERHSRVLEIGCGRGLALALVAARLEGGRVVGVDRSEKMTAVARERNAGAIRDGRVRVITGAFPATSPDGPFDLAFAIDVRLFEQSLEAAARVRDVPAPGGSVHLFYGAPVPAHADRFARGAESSLLSAGFDAIGATSEPGWVALSGVRRR